MPGHNRSHYRGDYARRAAIVRRNANANPLTRCWRCGKTKAEHGRKWQAGHLNDGQAGGPLAAECEGCNTSAGALLLSARRRNLRPTRRW